MVRGLGAGAWVECRGLHRTVRGWWCGGYVLWLAIVRLEEPPAFRRAALGFYWSAAEAALLLGIALLPLVWVVRRRPQAAAWSLRAAVRPSQSVLVAWLGIVAFGAGTAAACTIAAVTVHSIFGAPPAWVPAGALTLEAWMLLLPAAALAPALAQLQLPIQGAALVWLALLGLSFTRGVPIPTDTFLILRSPGTTMTTPIHGLLPVALATLGGLLLSTGLLRWRLRRTERCASESSATFTATSKP